MNDLTRHLDLLPVTPAGGVGRRAVLQALAGAAALAGLTGGALAQGQATQGRPTRGGVLRVSANHNPSSLDPITGRSGYDHMILFTMFDSLFEWDYDALTVRPGLAKSWTYKDPRTLVVELQDGVRFHDGEPCDARAVKFNLDRGRGDQRSVVKADLASIEGVEATGPLQVTIALKYPDSALLLILSDRAGMMASPKAVQALGVEADRKPVGSGPWKFVSFTDNDKVVVTRNENHWRKDRPNLDGIEFSIIPEVSTGLRSVVAGQNDFVTAVPVQQKAVAERAKGLSTMVNPTLFVQMFFLNCGRAPLDNLKVRQALALGVDRESFLKATEAGLGEPATTLLPKQHWAYDPETVKAFPYDPDRARRLLAEAGLAGGLELNCIGVSDQRSVQKQEVLIEQYQRIGVKLKFRQYAISDASAVFFGPEKQGDAYFTVWTGRPDPSLTFRLLFAKDSYFNAGNVDPAPGRAEAQLETQASDDLGERKKAFAKLQRIVNENVLFVPVAIQYDLAALGSKLKGYRPNLLGKPKFEDAYLSA